MDAFGGSCSTRFSMRLPDYFTRISPLAQFSRPRCLQLGSLGWLTKSLLADPAAARANPTTAEAPSHKPIRSCIVIFHYGGPSQLETFDPKPLAPAEARGEYSTINTAVPGVTISDHLPLTASLMNRIA